MRVFTEIVYYEWVDLLDVMRISSYAYQHSNQAVKVNGWFHITKNEYLPVSKPNWFVSRTQQPSRKS